MTGCSTARLALLRHVGRPNRSLCKPRCICQLPHSLHLHDAAWNLVDAGPLCSAFVPGAVIWPLRVGFVVAHVPVALPLASERLSSSLDWLDSWVLPDPVNSCSSGIGQLQPCSVEDK